MLKLKRSRDSPLGHNSIALPYGAGMAKRSYTLTEIQTKSGWSVRADGLGAQLRFAAPEPPLWEAQPMGPLPREAQDGRFRAWGGPPGFQDSTFRRRFSWTPTVATELKQSRTRSKPIPAHRHHEMGEVHGPDHPSCSRGARGHDHDKSGTSVPATITIPKR